MSLQLFARYRVNRLVIKPCQLHKIIQQKRTIRTINLSTKRQIQIHRQFRSSKISIKPTFFGIQFQNRTFTNNINNNNTTNNPNLDETKSLHKEHRSRQKEQLQDIVEGTLPNLQRVKHPKHAETADIQHAYDVDQPDTEPYVMPHKIWSDAQTSSIKITHVKPTKFADYFAYISVQILRFSWDFTTGYFFSKKLKLFKFKENNWLLRVVYLETVAGVPGMMFGMVRHLNSLRHMRRDHGWIHTLLAEAENERMHLLTFLKLYEPGSIFRYAVVIAQFLMSNFLLPAYLISPRYCHRFVGYLEEEAVKTYTGFLKDIDAGLLPRFQEPCSQIARDYWQLPKDATWRDVIAQVRADESHHRDVNHTLAPLAKSMMAKNPYRNENMNNEPPSVKSRD